MYDSENTTPFLPGECSVHTGNLRVDVFKLKDYYVIKAAIPFCLDIFLPVLHWIPYPEWFVSVFAIVGIVLDWIEIGLTFEDL